MTMPEKGEPLPRPLVRGSAVAVVILLVFLLPVLYVLSLAPACYLVSIDRLSADAYMSFYAPLVWLAEHSDTIGLWLDSYVEWYFAWIGYDPNGG